MSDHDDTLREFAELSGVTWRRGQREAILEVLSARDDGAKCVMIDAPTGAGKSLIAIASAWALAREELDSYILVSDLSLQDQYVQDVKQIGLAWPSVAGVKNYTCGEVSAPVSVAWCSPATLSKLGVKRRELPCYRECEYHQARDRALEARVTVLNYAYWLMQMNYVNVRLVKRECDAAFKKRAAQFMDEAHKLDIIVHNHCAVKLDKRLDTALSRLKRVISGRDVKKLAALREALSTQGAPVTELAADLSATLASVEADAGAWRDSLDPGVKTRDPMTTTMLHAVADIRDTHCKAEDYAEIIKPSDADATVTVESDCVTLNTLDTKSLMTFMLNRNSTFRVMMSATWGASTTAKSALVAAGARVVRVKSEFSFAGSELVKCYVGDMSSKSRTASAPAVAEALAEILRAHAGLRGVIHTGSYEICSDMIAALPPELAARVVTYDGSLEKAAALRAHASKSDSVLAGPSLLEGINLPDDLCRFVVFLKCPFPYLGDKWVAAKANKSRAWYAWKTALAIEQGCGRGIRHKSDWCNVFFLDAAFERQLKHSESFSDTFRQRLREAH